MTRSRTRPRSSTISSASSRSPISAATISPMSIRPTSAMTCSARARRRAARRKAGRDREIRVERFCALQEHDKLMLVQGGAQAATALKETLEQDVEAELGRPRMDDPRRGRGDRRKAQPGADERLHRRSLRRMRQFYARAQWDVPEMRYVRRRPRGVVEERTCLMNSFLLTILTAFATAIITWFATNYYGRNLLRFWDLRLEAHKAIFVSSQIRSEIPYVLAKAQDVLSRLYVLGVEIDALRVVVPKLILWYLKKRGYDLHGPRKHCLRFQIH